MIFCGEKGGAPAAKGRGNLRAFRQSGEGAGESDAGGGKSGSGEETGKDACLNAGSASTCSVPLLNSPRL